MNDYKFGNFICQLRIEKGLSQSQLGNMIGVSNKAVSKWEMGASKPRPEMLVTLATLFGVTVEELLAGERKAETEKEELKESRDITIKLWAGEYLKKKKYGRIAVLTSALLPIILFVWVGVIVELNLSDKIFGPIVTMIIIFAEVIVIALIFVFYGSARRLKRILYTAYHEQTEEITAIILPKRKKIPMLKWEKVCCIVIGSIIILCYVLRIIVHCIVGKGNILRIYDIVTGIIACLGYILEITVLICYFVRAQKINKQNK